MKKKKKRIQIPPTIAAEVLFAANRTCCVCRDSSHPVQVHHIDDNPSNNETGNLAVLCLPCHDTTQLSGGFSRKLDAHQVRLYKEDWDSKVRHFRIIGPEPIESRKTSPGMDVRLATTLPEIFKEEGDIHSLISFYDEIGNADLRDRYIAELLESNPEPWVVAWVARLQGRSNEVPSEVFDRAIADAEDDYLVESGLLSEAGRPVKAAIAMVRGILDSLENGNLFNAAYNMKRLGTKPFIEEMFKITLERKVANHDLWWQFRCFQELGWETETRNLLTSNEAEIRAGDNLLLRRELARVTGDSEYMFAMEQQIAHAGVSAYFGDSEAKEFEVDDEEGNLEAGTPKSSSDS